MKRTALSFLVLCFCALSCPLITAQSPTRLSVTIKESESWWIGVINHGSLFPIQDKYEADLRNNCYGNQAQSLLLSSNGRSVWSDEPFKITSLDNTIVLEKDSGAFEANTSGTTLRDAYIFASKKYFPASGKMPNEFLFSSPQYNTWIELLYNQNEKDILKYAKGILDNGFPPGTLMIDDNWQENYGTWRFHPGRFSNPKAMIDTLHSWGFKIMVWVCPFVSADSETFRKLQEQDLLLREKDGYPKLVKWWNGASAVLDLTDDKAVTWFKNELKVLMEQYGVDGFKFDAGDPEFYADVYGDKKLSPNEHTELFNMLGVDYSFIEFRAGWQAGGQPLAQRLRDKGHTWSDLQILIPDILLQGIMGYPFTCPDMIGGGEMGSFANLKNINQDLVVRSAQCHAFMPMMQFSVAPWRILDSTRLRAVEKAIQLRMKYVPLIRSLANEAAIGGEPIVRYMAYQFPDQAFEKVNDQFMLGSTILIAPILSAANTRTVVLPKGKWTDGRTNKTIVGPKTFQTQANIDEIPFYIKKN
jgi:alpha-glucosidase (family GH31 glycosyl hydrolase)